MPFSGSKIKFLIRIKLNKGRTAKTRLWAIFQGSQLSQKIDWHESKDTKHHEVDIQDSNPSTRKNVKKKVWDHSGCQPKDRFCHSTTPCQGPVRKNNFLDLGNKAHIWGLDPPFVWLNHARFISKQIHQILWGS